MSISLSMQTLVFSEKSFVTLLQLTNYFLSQFTLSLTKITDDINGSQQVLWAEF